jgi:2-hydroxychromene-2-carboxylate isomerase
MPMNLIQETHRYVVMRKAPLGDLLHFPVGRARFREGHARSVPAFFFDVTSPLSYLAAERVERQLPEAEWVAVDGATLAPPPESAEELARVRSGVEARARALRLPLVWPEEFPVLAPCAQRASAFACELGAGPTFALAAGRLAFCGGFRLDDPEVLAEAAAAAAVPLVPCLEAARESWRDEELGEVTAALQNAGIDRLPAFRVGSHWLQGEDSLTTASAMLVRHELAQGPLAPVG